MHERFSDRARHAMALANLEATQLKHDNLRPAHLMLGLIAEGECIATEALRLLNVDIDRVRDEVRRELNKSGAEGSMSRRIHTKELKEVMRIAVEETRRLHHRYIGTEHLILGLLSQVDSIPSRALRSQGLDLDTLREKALGMLRSDVDDLHDVSRSQFGDFEWVHQQELAKAFRSDTFWHTMILAVDSANRMGSGEVRPLHLLLALLRDNDNGVSNLLAEKGVTANWVREQLTAGNE